MIQAGTERGSMRRLTLLYVERYPGDDALPTGPAILTAVVVHKRAVLKRFFGCRRHPAVGSVRLPVVAP